MRLLTKIHWNIVRFFNGRKKFELFKYKNIGIVFLGRQLGDTLAMTSMLKPLKDNGFNVTVFCSANSFDILKNNQHIDNLIDIDCNKVSKEFKDYQIDLLLDLSYNRSDYERFELKRKINPTYSICLYLHTTNKKEPTLRRLTRIHNEVINYKGYDKHCTYIFKAILERLNIYVKADLDYEFNLESHYLTSAQNLINTFGDKKIIIFNPYANLEIRSFSEEQIYTLLNFFNTLNHVQVIVIGEPKKIESLKLPENCYLHIDKDINSAIALLALSNLVVSVDTSIAHFSRCFNKKLICVYTNLIFGKWINNLHWAPFYENATQLFSPTKEAKDFDVTVIENKIKELI